MINYNTPIYPYLESNTFNSAKIKGLKKEIYYKFKIWEVIIDSLPNREKQRIVSHTVHAPQLTIFLISHGSHPTTNMVVNSSKKTW